MTAKPIKLGILQCDSVLEQYQPQFGNYPQMITELFHAIDPTIEIHHYDVQHNRYPRNINECDAYITTGSKASVYDDEIWIHKLEDYIRALHAAEKKLIGICFGHQLIAQALGGKTANAAQGWGVGVHSNQIVHQATWMEPYQTTIDLVVSHKDQVIDLPAEAILIARNDFCPHAAFQIGDHFLTVQGHPEFSKDYSSALMTHRRNILGEACYQQGMGSLNKATDHLTFTRWMLAFIHYHS